MILIGPSARTTTVSGQGGSADGNECDLDQRVEFSHARDELSVSAMWTLRVCSILPGGIERTACDIASSILTLS